MQRRNGTIDVLRFVFMLLVMCFHTHLCMPGGFIGVEFFFIVSGYLMAHSMSRMEPDPSCEAGIEAVEFIAHKASSIFPYYVVAWLLSFGITTVADSLSVPQVVEKFVLSPYNFFMVQMAGCFDLGHRVQGSWYISAMLLAMFVIYPVRRRYRDLFDNYLVLS